MAAFTLQAEKTAFSIGFDFERFAADEGYMMIAGVDEVGRGCLAGPVVAAACILDLSKHPPKGLNDSKKLTAKRRAEIAAELKETAVAYAIGQVEADEIDRINILEATRKAMAGAISALEPAADFLLIDAVNLKQVILPQRSLIKGDAVSFSIAAASVLAKTYRDDLMVRFADEYPQYGFDGHKGYGSAFHFAALRSYGPCPLHRTSFRGVLS
ncbi:MAG: ribonuclease HII [Acidobacteria bacterium]|nr:ribonuclease HII [Acidobacteriota bacterium]